MGVIQQDIDMSTALIADLLWTVAFVFNLVPSKCCNAPAKLINVGDQKEFLVYVCAKCFRTPVHNNEARCTEYGAREIWNRRVKSG